MKRYIFFLVSVFGICWVFRFLHRNRLIVLLYHGIAPNISAGIYNYRKKFISPEAFESQMRFLSSKYTIVKLDDALVRLQNGTLPPYALAVTFDDGYRNNWEYAFPILKKYAIPATIYLTGAFVRDGIPLWVDRLEYAISYGTRALPEEHEARKKIDSTMRAALKNMTRADRESALSALEQEVGIRLQQFDDPRAAVYAPLTTAMIGTMHVQGITFGAHSMSHPILSNIPGEELVREIEDSKACVVMWCGDVSPIFAYPNGQPGDWNTTVERAVRAAGFVGALTTIPGSNTKTTHPYSLQRVSMDGTESWSVFCATVSLVRRWGNGISRKNIYG